MSLRKTMAQRSQVVYKYMIQHAMNIEGISATMSNTSKVSHAIA